MARKGKESKAALNKRILPTYSVELLPKRQNLLVPSGHTSKTERGTRPPVIAGPLSPHCALEISRVFCNL